MAGEREQQDLFPSGSTHEDAVVINDRCQVRTRDGHRVVIVAGIVHTQFAVGDRMAKAHAMVSLVEQGWASQVDVARAFGCSQRTLRRYERRLEKGGLAALGRPGGYPTGRSRLKTSRLRLVEQLKTAGVSNREVARRLGVSEMAVRKLLRRLGWTPALPQQVPLAIDPLPANPNLSALPSSNPHAVPTSPPQAPSPSGDAAPASADPNLSAFREEFESVSFDTDPADRRIDRLLAYLGLLNDAAPMFRSGRQVPRAGVLLALPALVASGIFENAQRIYGSIGPAFYGLRTTLVALLLMALLRIKRPEALKEHSPEDLGRLLGLDRAPEVKTLRRKLERLAALGGATEFGRALAQRRVAERGAVLGFLYLDGHVRAYHGRRTLPKAHVARMRLSMPATTDYWVNDAVGDPLFVVTAEANAGLAKMLPGVLEEVRGLVGERRVTVVFDRGGYSPKLFVKLIAGGFDLLTYRKGRFRQVPRSCFRVHDAAIAGKMVSYTLADQEVRLLKGKLRLRQVTRRSEDGHQTPILTSRRDLSTAEVAYRMFERWRQENFFKYLREEYALDALVDYGVVPDNPVREVPNPRWTKLDKELRKARDRVANLASQYGAEAFVNREAVRPTTRGLKIVHGKLGKHMRDALRRVVSLQKKRKAVPGRVPVADVVTGDVVRLAPERKLLTNLVKMVAYQVESDLVRLVAPHYKRVEDEGRTLIQTILAGAADLEVTDTELRVRMAPLSSAHRTRALSAMCDELDRCATRFPGSRLRLRYAVAAEPARPKTGQSR